MNANTSISRRIKPSKNLVPPSTYAWIIDTDHLFNSDPENAGRNDRGTCGPSNAPDVLIGMLHTGLGETFEMRDDDGNLYYTGRLIGEFDGLEPLDDFGTPNAGATDIRVGTPGNLQTV